jgi:hypothetical protein
MSGLGGQRDDEGSPMRCCQSTALAAYAAGTEGALDKLQLKQDAMNLKHGLCDIETDGRDRLEPAPPNHECPNSTHIDGACRAGGGAVHSIKGSRQPLSGTRARADKKIRLTEITVSTANATAKGLKNRIFSPGQGSPVSRKP